MTTRDNDAARVERLACWSGPVEIAPLGGGITNVNYTVDDGAGRYVVRLGGDIPVHGISRASELAAARAAHAAGIGPEIVHAEPGALVMRFVAGETLDEAGVRARLDRLVPVVARCHREIPAHFRGPTPMFWVFQVLRDYAATLVEGGSRLAGEVPGYLETAARLEAAVGPIEVVFGHNDLLAANFIDDGERIWLLDWEYAGFGSPLFDLGGLASNNGLGDGEERALLEAYFERPADGALLARYRAMKCASLLRESMWSMVSELHSTLDVDYVAYTAENLERLERALAELDE